MLAFLQLLCSDYVRSLIGIINCYVFIGVEFSASFPTFYPAYIVLCIFFDHVEGEVENKHHCYVYSLGVCEVNQCILKCSHQDTCEEGVEKLTVAPWWSKSKSKATNKNSQWPDKPK